MKLRHWLIEDAKELSQLLNNKKILDNLRDGLPYPYIEKDAEEYIEFMLSSDKGKTFPFAITVDDKVVGSIGVFRKENIHYRTAELGYYISENYWGKGIGTEAIKQICKYVFSNTDIIRIFAEPFSTNIASCKVLEKSGFQLEGILRKNAEKNGEILDMKLYSIIKETKLENTNKVNGMSS
jgi:RimJ/RimL family protein N-acetyltransferase